MPPFSDLTWIVLALISGFGILQILRALAIGVRNATMIHDLRVGVAELQVQQFHAQMVRHGVIPRGEADVEIMEADIVGEDPSPAPHATPAETPAEPVAATDDEPQLQAA